MTTGFPHTVFSTNFVFSAETVTLLGLTNTGTKPDDGVTPAGILDMANSGYHVYGRSIYQMNAAAEKLVNAGLVEKSVLTPPGRKRPVKKFRLTEHGIQELKEIVDQVSHIQDRFKTMTNWYATNPPLTTNTD